MLYYIILYFIILYYIILYYIIYIYLYTNVLFCDVPFLITWVVMPCLAQQVILVSDPDWTQHPVGRAHWRLLWTVGDGKMLGVSRWCGWKIMGKSWKMLGKWWKIRFLKPKSKLEFRTPKWNLRWGLLREEWSYHRPATGAHDSAVFLLETRVSWAKNICVDCSLNQFKTRFNLKSPH